MTKDDAIDQIIALTCGRPQSNSQNWNRVRMLASRYVAWLAPSGYSIDVDDDGLTLSGDFWSISIARGTRKHGNCRLSLDTRLDYNAVIDILKIVGIVRRPSLGMRADARKTKIAAARQSS